MRVWQPLGFGNVFEMPSCTPVTPETLKRVPVAVHELSFHEQRFLSCLHRNGVTRADLEAGYMIPAGGVQLEPLQLHFYRSLGIAL